MDVIEKYYSNMTNERYYWCSTLISLMKKKYRYRQAKKILKECPLTENIYSDGGWAYFHDMDTEDWVEIICRWELQRKEKKEEDEKKQTKEEKCERLGITVDKDKGLQYKRPAIKREAYLSIRNYYKKRLRMNRNTYGKNMKLKKTMA